jgi:hypothetical protein
MERGLSKAVNDLNSSAMMIGEFNVTVTLTMNLRSRSVTYESAKLSQM